MTVLQTDHRTRSLAQAERRPGTTDRLRWSAVVSIALAALAGATATVGLVTVLVAGFALSLDAMSAVARAAHVRSELGWLLPAAVDGAMAVGTVAIVVMRRFGQSATYPWAVVLVNAGFSVFGNALHAHAGSSLELPRSVAMTVSAVPAINLALSVHLLVVLVDALATHVAQTSGSVRGAGPGLDQTDAATGQHSPTKDRSGTGPEPSGPVRRSKQQDHQAEQAAVAAYQASMRAGQPLSERKLADRYGRSRRWARHIKELATDARPTEQSART